MALPAGIDPSQIPAFDTTPTNTQSKPGPIRGGLGAGLHELIGTGGSILQGLGALTDVQPIEQAGQSIADTQNRIAQRVGRPDLDVAPWQQGGASVAPWLEYQAAKMLPSLAGFFVSGGAAPATEAGAAAARLLPEFLGGVGAEATPAEVKAASKFLTGVGGFGGATGFGQAIQSAAQSPGGLTQGNAAQALAESPLYAAAGVLEPGFLKNALGGAEGKIAQRVITRAVSGSAVGAVQSGSLAALDSSFNPNMSVNDRMNNIVDAAVTGAAVGGTFGGLTGIRAMKRADPAALLNNTEPLDLTIDEALNNARQGPPSQPQGPPTEAEARQGPPSQLPAPAQPGGPQIFSPPGGNMFANDLGQVATFPEMIRATPADIGFRINEVRSAEPALPSPTDISDRSAVPGSTIVVGRRGENGRFTNDATGVEQPPVVPEDTSRAYRNYTTDELAAAANALANKREADGKLPGHLQDVARAIDSELALRLPSKNTLTNNDANNPQVEAVERGEGANRRGTGEQPDSGAPASTTSDIKARISELTDGLKLPPGLKDKLASARSENDIQDIVHDQVIVQGKSGKNIDALGQRAGVLDDTGKPTALADEISARQTQPGDKTPSPTFMAEWKDDVKSVGQKDPTVRSLNPVNRQDAMLQLYRALGNYDLDTRDFSDKQGRSPGGLEQLAQKYGVLDDNKQLTPAGLELAKQDPINPDEAKAAAKAQGFKGSDIMKFVRSVQDYTGERKLSDAVAGDAAHAGGAWAEETNSVPKGAMKQYVGRDVTDKDVANVDGTAPKPETREVPPEVRQGQQVNEAIDNANLQPAKRESDIATLKNMVRSGDIQGAMDGLRRVTRGETLFKEPERDPAEPFKGARVDATSRALAGARGKAQQELDLQRDAAGAGKAYSRAEAERAIRHYELSQKIDAAHAEGSIDSRDRLSLINKLRQGKVGDVIAVVGPPNGKIEGPIAAATNRAERRAALYRDMQDAVAEHARDNEVPELNVDQNGILQGRRYQIDADGRPTVTAEDRKTASDLLSHVIDGATPKDIMLRIAAMGGDLGKMAARFAKYIPDDVKMEAVTRQEMNQTLEGLKMAPDTPGSGTTQGLWDDKSRTIFMSTAVMHPSVFLHEAAHAIMSAHIEEGTSIGKQITAAFNKLKPDLPKGDYAATNAHEFMSEFLSRQQVRDYVQKISDSKPGNIFQRIWNAIRTAFGNPPQSAVEKLLNLAEAAGQNPVDGGKIASSPLLMRAPELNDHVRDSVGKIGDIADHVIERADPTTRLRKAMLYFGGENTMLAKFGKFFETAQGNGMHERMDAIDRKGQMRNILSRPSIDVNNQFRALKNVDPKAASLLNHLIQLTANGIHPFRDWAHQSDAVKANPDNKPALDEAQKIIRQLKAKDAADKSTMRLDAYSAMHDHENAQMLQQFADDIHQNVVNNVLSSGRVPGFEQHPVDMLMDRTTRETFDTRQFKQFWQDEVTKRLTALDGFISGQQATADKMPTTTDEEKAGKAALVRNIDKLNDLSAQVKTGLAKLASGPNFHLGRSGDYFVDMKLRTDKDGNADKAALKAAAAHFKDFGVVIPANAQADHIFMRVESPSAQNALYQKAQELQAKGIVTETPAAGKRSDGSAHRIASPLRTMLEGNIRSRTDISDETKDELIKSLRSTSIDSLSDNSIAKFLAPREYVPGFQEDMIDSFLQRAQAANNSMVGRVTAPKIANAYAKMEEAVRGANQADIKNVPLTQRNAMQDALAEMRTRDSRANYEQTPVIDAMRRVANFWALGGTVAYPVVLFSQLPMVALPKLGSKFGFVRTSKAMAAVTPEAFRIMKAVFKTATDVNGLSAIQKGSNAANVEISLQALRAAGVDAKTAEYLMHIVNHGQLGVGSQAHALSAAANGSTDGAFNHTMQYASGLAYYTETLTRVITALAQLKLSGDHSIDSSMAASQLLKDSLFDYRLDVQGRAFGRAGVFGSKTPLMTQFTTYQSQLVQRLYLELHDAFTKGVEPQRQGEARAFLMQHAAVTTALAGSLGLPFATAAAAAYNRIKDKVDPSGGPSDVMTDYRNFLSDMFGKDVGEVIARGALRPLGVDMSERIGEQNELPFSKFLADRRAFKDSAKDLAMRMLGAPANMAINAYAGGEKLAGGDVIGGLATMLPAALNNPYKAYQMTQQGYTDTKGNKLPIATPGTDAVIAQLLGFTPEAKGEYQEAKSAQVERSGILQRQAAQMRNQIAQAIITGDHDGARSMIDQAKEFDQANPAYQVLSGLPAAIAARQKSQVISQRFGTPAGVNPKDLGARSFTRFANVDYGSQQ